MDRKVCGPLWAAAPTCKATSLDPIVADAGLPTSTGTTVGWRFINDATKDGAVANYRNGTALFQKINWYFFGQAQGTNATQYKFSAFRSFWVSDCRLLPQAVASAAATATSSIACLMLRLRLRLLMRLLLLLLLMPATSACRCA